MPLTRIDSAFLDLDAIGGIDFDVQSGVPTLKVDAVNHRVGVGTATPAAALHVLTGEYPSLTVQRNHAVNYPRLRLTNTSNHGADLDGIGDGSPAGGFRVSTITSGTSTERVRITAAGDVEARRNRSNTIGDVALSLQPSDSTIHYGFRIDSANNNLNIDKVSGTATNLLSITAAGDVGIGNANPQSKLQIENAGEQLRLTYPSIASYIHEVKSNGDYAIDKDGTERVRITSGGSLQVKGDVNPNAVFDRGSANTTNVNFNYNGTLTGQLGAANQEFQISAAGSSTPLVAYVNGSERLRIDSSGRLLKSGQAALASTSLSHPFQVAAASDANTIAIIGRASDDIGELSFYEADKSTKLGELQYRQDHLNFRHRVGYISFATGGTTERLRIDSSGRIGIGAFNNSSYDAIAQNFLIANESSHAGMTIRSGGSGAFGAIHFADGVADNTEKRAGRILYSHGSDFMSFCTTNTERLKIDSLGSAQFTGQNAPSGLDTRISQYGSLLVATTGELLSNARCSIDSGNGTITTIGNGLFAVNTSTYQTGINLHTSSNLSTLTVYSNNSSTHRSFVVYDNGQSGAAKYRAAIYANGSAQFAGGDFEINETGNAAGKVNIDSTSDGGNSAWGLSVKNNDSRSGRPTLKLQNVGGANAIEILNAGGTANTTVITSAGAATFSADATINTLTVGLGAGGVSSNTAVGYQALYSNTTAAQNTAVGYLALYSNTAIRNTAVGWEALKANTSGSGNIALGAYAGTANTTGSNNSFIGYDSAPVNTSGANNTTLGAASLHANTSGGGNTAIGKAALYWNTTGQYNTAIGRDALSSNTTASQNTAVGYQALLTNSTGYNNVAVGHHSLYGNTTGSFCIAIGVNAAKSSTTAVQNTVIGYKALESTTSGSYNTIVGYEAAKSGTTGGYNTVFGREALYTNTIGNFNVAIGQSTLLLNTTAGYNVGVGYQAIRANTTGEDHVAMGYQTLYSNTTGQSNTALGRTALYTNTTGGSNVAVGRDALKDNTTGSYNTAVGRVALTANTTGGNNTAVGFQALATNTTGGANAAFGQDALRANISGNNNVAVGYRAMDGNTIGGENTVAGYQALKSNTSGNNNAAFGFESLNANTTGDNNSGFGLYTLLQNTTGHENVAAGRSSMQNNTTGYYNVSIGTQCLINNTTGISNTAMGYKAMYGNSAARYNTAVGYNALYGSTNTGERITAMGYQAGYSNTSGGYSTSIGMYAAYYNTTGQANTALAYTALHLNTTGGHNTALGYQALYNSTTASYNTACGMNAGITTTTGQGNTFVGYNVNATTATTDTSIVIGKDITGINGNGYVTIGMNSTSDKIYNNFKANATWTRNSDVRLKKDIVTNTDCGLDFINDLRTVTYKWRAPSELDQTMSEYNPNKTEASYEGTMHGFIAQEVKQALDDNNITDFAGWTSDNTADDLQGVSYEMFVMPLVKSVQELTTMVKELQAEVAALKGV